MSVECNLEIELYLFEKKIREVEVNERLIRRLVREESKRLGVSNKPTKKSINQLEVKKVSARVNKNNLFTYGDDARYGNILTSDDVSKKVLIENKAFEFIKEPWSDLICVDPVLLTSPMESCFEENSIDITSNINDETVNFNEIRPVYLDRIKSVSIEKKQHSIDRAA